MLAVSAGRTAGPEAARDNARPDRDEKMGTGVRLSDAAIADLAQALCVPEELFRMIVDHYPDLCRALVWRFGSPHQACG